MMLNILNIIKPWDHGILMDSAHSETSPRCNSLIETAYPVLRHQHLVGACRDHRTMVLNSSLEKNNLNQKCHGHAVVTVVPFAAATTIITES
jgi:hypothetical protein